MPPDESPAPRVHFLIVFAAFVVSIAGIKEARDIVVQVLAAGFLAAAIAPLTFWLQRKGAPFAVALAVVVALALTVLGFMAGVVGASVNEFTTSLPEYEARAQEGLRQIGAVLERLGVEQDIEQTLTGMIDPGQAMNLVGRLFSGVGAVLANSFLIFIMAVFLMLEASTFPDKLQAAFGERGRAVERFSLLAAGVNRYLTIKTWISLATGALAALLCFALGVDFALLWGLLAFLLNYVPNIGSILAAVPPTLLALLQFGPGKALILLVGYVVINNVIGNVVEPRFMGEGLGLSPFAVILSLVFWGWVLGPVGMLLSIPLTMGVKIAMEGAPETRWIAILLSAGTGEQ